MKAILEFYLPEDEEEYTRARDGASYYSILNELREGLRSKLKYNPPKDKKAYDALNSVYENLFSLANEYGVSLD